MSRWKQDAPLWLIYLLFASLIFLALELAYCFKLLNLTDLITIGILEVSIFTFGILAQKWGEGKRRREALLSKLRIYRSNWPSLLQHIGTMHPNDTGVGEIKWTGDQMMLAFSELQKEDFQDRRGEIQTLITDIQLFGVEVSRQITGVPRMDSQLDIDAASRLTERGDDLQRRVEQVLSELE